MLIFEFLLLNSYESILGQNKSLLVDIIDHAEVTTAELVSPLLCFIKHHIMEKDGEGKVRCLAR